MAVQPFIAMDGRRIPRHNYGVIRRIDGGSGNPNEQFSGLNDMKADREAAAMQIKTVPPKKALPDAPWVREWKQELAQKKGAAGGRPDGGGDDAA
jgi:hypothetical protein